MVEPRAGQAVDDRLEGLGGGREVEDPVAGGAPGGVELVQDAGAGSGSGESEPLAPPFSANYRLEEAIDALRTHYPEYLLPTIIRQCTKFAQASSEGRPVFVADPSSKGAMDIEALRALWTEDEPTFKGSFAAPRWAKWIVSSSFIKARPIVAVIRT